MVKKYYNIKTIQNLIENIAVTRAPVFSTYERVSIVSFSPASFNNGRVAEVKPIKFEMSIQDNGTEFLKFLPQEQQELFLKYDPKMWEILHEIGHIKTAVGLSWTKLMDEKPKLQRKADKHNMPIGDQQKEYRQLVSERRADKWAYNWALKHPKEMEFASHNLRVTMW